jgi:uncharacterized membrane protein
MKREIKGLLYRLPAAILIILVAVIGSYIVKIGKILPNASWFAPLFLTVLLILYIIGEYISLKGDNYPL